jgi:hypothetical protein
LEALTTFLSPTHKTHPKLSLILSSGMTHWTWVSHTQLAPQAKTQPWTYLNRMKYKTIFKLLTNVLHWIARTCTWIRR